MLSKSQQPRESVDLYIMDKFNLFQRATATKARDFEDFLDYTIRGFENANLKRRVRESCVLNRPVDFRRFRSSQKTAGRYFVKEEKDKGVHRRG